jgi:hypothetical protein
LLFSKGQTEQFSTAGNSDAIVVLVPTNQALLQQIPNLIKGVVFIRLRETPIPQTIQLQWYVSVQPKGSYGVLDGTPNVIVFNWGDPIESLKQHPLEVTYIADKPNSRAIHILSVKDGFPYGDGKPLPLNGFAQVLLTSTPAIPSKK